MHTPKDFCLRNWTWKEKRLIAIECARAHVRALACACARARHDGEILDLTKSKYEALIFNIRIVSFHFSFVDAEKMSERMRENTNPWPQEGPEDDAKIQRIP